MHPKILMIINTIKKKDPSQLGKKNTLMKNHDTLAFHELSITRKTEKLHGSKFYTKL